MIAIDEIDVGVTGRSEQDRGAGSVAGGGVSGGIVLSEIGFDFDDAGGEMQRFRVAHQDFAEKIASYATWAASVEGARERKNGTKRGGRRHRFRSQNAELGIQKSKRRVDGSGSVCPA